MDYKIQLFIFICLITVFTNISAQKIFQFESSFDKGYFIQHEDYDGITSRKSNSFDRWRAAFYFEKGLSDNRMMSLRSTVYPDYYLCVSNNRRVVLRKITSSSSKREKESATWDVHYGLGNQRHNSIESIAYVGEYLVWNNSKKLVLIEPQSADEKKRATFIMNRQVKLEDRVPGFPIEISPNCNRIKDRSWRCCGRATILSSGLLTARIETSSNNLRGFTGAIEFTFYDDLNVPIYTVISDSYGVNTNDERVSTFKINVDKEILKLVHRVEAQGIHSPSRENLEELTEMGVEALKIYISGGPSGK